jgi:carotenoid cleavage dioxygenase
MNPRLFRAGRSQYGIVSPTGELLKTVPISIPQPVMMHDFAITEHYTLFLDLPLAFQPRRLLEGELPVFFDWSLSSRIGIMPRHGDGEDVTWFVIPPCAVIHTVNAYEEGDEVVLLACRMDFCNLLMPFYNSYRLEKVDLETLKLYRWRFNLKSGTVKEEVVDDLPSEFPRINDARLGRRMRYAYAARVAAYMKPKPLFDGVIKYDLDNEVTEVHELGRGRFCGETVFVPRPGGTLEDDGWLLTFVWDAVAQQSELLILNAQDVVGEPIARVLIPERIPYGFHAGWFE